MSSSLFSFNTDRKLNESDLAIHLAKATSSDQLPPKKKHIEGVILFSCQNESTIPFWNILKLQPILTSKIRALKALILIHHLMLRGPPSTINQASSEESFIKKIETNSLQFSDDYDRLIKNYVEFLISKINLHLSFPQISGNFEGNSENLSNTLKNDTDGFNLLSKLIAFQNKIQLFCEIIIVNKKTAAYNEIFSISLVPFIEETSRLYNLLTSLVMIFTDSNPTYQKLQSIIRSYNYFHSQARKLFHECSELEIVRRNISIPSLSEESTIDIHKIQSIAQSRNTKIAVEKDSDSRSKLARSSQIHPSLTDDSFQSSLIECNKTTSDENRENSSNQSCDLNPLEEFDDMSDHSSESDGDSIYQKLALEIQMHLHIKKIKEEQYKEYCQKRAIFLEKIMSSLDPLLHQFNSSSTKIDFPTEPIKESNCDRMEESFLHMLNHIVSECLNHQVVLQNSIQLTKDQLNQLEIDYDTLLNWYTQVRQDHVELLEGERH